MEASAHAPPTISLSPMGPQHLDKHGDFPIEPVGMDHTPHKRECVVYWFSFSNLYTAVDTPAGEAA